jgi:O-methyltransferase
MDNTFILALQRGSEKNATWPMRLAAPVLRLFNGHNRHFVLKFRRDDLNRYFGIKYSHLDPNENLLQGGMISLEQAVNIYHLLTQAVLMDVPGDVVELGCYEGTTAIVMQKTLDQHRSSKTLHVYDSFAGLPARSPEDGDTRFQPGDCQTTKQRLIQNFQRSGVKLPVVHEGWFTDTLPDGLPPRICFAHVDCDFYSSVRQSLEAVYPRLAPGGIVVVDDYTDPAVLAVNDILPGVKRACDEYLRDKEEEMHVLLAGSGSHGYFRKR